MKLFLDILSWFSLAVSVIALVTTILTHRQIKKSEENVKKARELAKKASGIISAEQIEEEMKKRGYL